MIKPLIRKILCKIFGHTPDWEEYDYRTRVEDRYCSGGFIQCKRCSRYNKL